MSPRKIIPYNPRLIPIARKLRNNSTLSEILLWRHLKGKQMRGYDFDRQKPIGNFIVDFFCQDLCLAIEIDGCSHELKGDYDLRRQRELEGLGVTVLRFDDGDVKKEMEAVLHMIRDQIQELEQQ